MAIEKKNTGSSTLQEQMSNIKDNMSTTQTFTQPADAGNAFRQGAAEQTKQAEATFGGFTSVFDIDNTSSLLGGSTGDMVNKLTEKTDKEIEELVKYHKVIQFSSVPVDKEVYQLHASAVILTALDIEKPRLGLVAHVMILEATSPPEDPYVVTLSGHAGMASRTISVPVMTSSVWDDEYRTSVVRAINMANNLDQANVPLICGVTVIPRNFDLEDKEAFSRMIRNVSNSLVTEIGTRRTTASIKLGKLQDGEYVAATVAYSNRHQKDALGLPQRSDVLVTVSQNKVRPVNNAGVRSLNDKSRNKKEIGQMAGFIDFFWNPVAPQQQSNMYGYASQQAVQTQKYSPAFIIRSLKTPISGMLEAQIVLLLTAGVIAKNNEWVNSLTTRWEESRLDSNRNRVNFGDVGALNIEGNLPQGGQVSNTKYGRAVNTIEDSFTHEQFQMYLGAMVRPELQYAIDMPIMGAESWYMDRFLESAKDANSVQSAHISQTLDTMTNNKFSECFKALGGGPLWLGKVVPYHTGYYFNEKDEMRDLADVDLLAVMNRLGATDPTVGERWARTWLPANDNSEVLLDERLAIIRDVLGGDNYVLTGWGARSFMNPNVIVALGQAAAGVNFDMALITPYAKNSTLQQRTTFEFNGVSGARAGSFDNVFQSRGNAQNSNQPFNQFGALGSHYG